MVTQPITITPGHLQNPERTPIILLASPYHPQMSALAKALGGKWSAGVKQWWFDPRDTDAVRKLCVRLYGVDPLAEDRPETVTVRIRVNDLASLSANSAEVAADAGDLWFAGRQIFRYGKLGDGCVIVAGKVGAGGSRRHPTYPPSNDMVVEVRDLSRSLVEQEIAAQGKRVDSVLTTLDQWIAQPDLVGHGWANEATWNEVPTGRQQEMLAAKRAEWRRIRDAHAARRDAITIVETPDAAEKLHEIVAANSAKPPPVVSTEPSPVERLLAEIAALPEADQVAIRNELLRRL